MNNIPVYVDKVCENAKKSSSLLATVKPNLVDIALLKMASLLDELREDVKKENKKDLVDAKNNGLSDAMIDRLTLDDKRIDSMIVGLKEVVSLKSPIGEKYDNTVRPNGLDICKMSVPIGVILIIFESRPNVTVDSAALCLKAGNGVILRGGKEALNSNKILATIFQKALSDSNLPEYAVQMIETKDRSVIDLLLKKNDSIDLVIPRGGESLIRAVTQKSSIPTIKHYKGVCHVFIEKDADLKKGKDIAINAKVQRPGVCNAMETLLLDEKLPNEFIKNLIDDFKKQGVVIKGCSKVCEISDYAVLAHEDDWYAEYLNLTLAVKIVSGLDEAVSHISKYGSLHTESIITENKDIANEFILRVDSASVMVNASTRFSDGGEYGLGAEIGISTDKIHARGPMGIKELTTYKWIVIGNGQIRI